MTISTLTRARIRFIALLELRSLVAAVGIELDQERKGAEQARHQQRAAVAVLDVGGVDDRVHQQALRIDEDVALLAFDLLAGIVARRINRRPPFSALLTLWLSMIAAVGRLAGRGLAALRIKRVVDAIERAVPAP